MLVATPSVELPVPSGSLLAQLAALPDPRVDCAKRHSLTDVLAIAPLATFLSTGAMRCRRKSTRIPERRLSARPSKGKGNHRGR
jgi:hypothetical protein